MIKSTIHFMRIRNIAFSITVVITLIGLGSLLVKGLNLGLDFTGGTALIVTYEKPADVEQIRKTLVDLKYKDPVVQNYGSTTDVLIRLDIATEDFAKAKQAKENSEQTENTVTDSAGIEEDGSRELGKKVVSELLAKDPSTPVKLDSASTVGSQVGKELLDKGGIACLLALVGILTYLAFRFQWKFGLGAVASLFHDLIVTLGVLAFFQIPVDLTVFAALLAMIGYSLNDTIIIYDRIRENFRVLRKAAIIENIDTSITQTLLRTMATSISTAMALIALLIFGGPSLAGFALVMLIGVFVGTYSSIYIAGPVLIWLNLVREDLLPPPSSQELKETQP